MDIFTTQLTRIVPVPIKPASLKVKALLKDAASNKLSQDPDHLENHEYYFTSEDDQYHSSQQGAGQEEGSQQENIREEFASEHDELTTKKTIETENSDEQTDQKNNKPKHLDLYA